MKVSRREFVNTAGCAAAAGLCALPSFGFAAASNPDARTSAGCTLLDLESNCALPESLAGMRASLSGAYRRVAEIAFDGTDSVVVVPAAGAVQAETFDSVRKLIEHGTTVLWESGAAFLEPSDFARQQALTLEHFGVSMAQPIDVWSRSASQRLNAEAKNQSARTCARSDTSEFPMLSFAGRVKRAFETLAAQFQFRRQRGKRLRTGEKFPLRGANRSARELSFLLDRRSVLRCIPVIPTRLPFSAR
jgi:hypothetical protein